MEAGDRRPRGRWNHRFPQRVPTAEGNGGGTGAIRGQQRDLYLGAADRCQAETWRSLPCDPKNDAERVLPSFALGSQPPKSSPAISVFLWVLGWGPGSGTSESCTLAFLWSSCGAHAARDGLKVTVPWGPSLTTGLGGGDPAAWSSLLPRTGQFSAADALQPRAQRAEPSAGARCKAGHKGAAEAGPSPSQAASCERVAGHPRTPSWCPRFSAFPRTRLDSREKRNRLFPSKARVPPRTGVPRSSRDSE